jgi:hypothetical protein
VRDDKCFLTRHEPWKGEAQRQHCNGKLPDVNLGRFIPGRGEVKAQATVSGVARVERQRANDEPREQQCGDAPESIARVGIELGCERINDKQNDRNDAALQDRLRLGEVVKGIAVEARAAVKVFLLSDFSPGRVDPDTDQCKEEIDDPDAEVLGGGTGELRTDRAGLRSRAIKRRGCGTCARNPIRVGGRFVLNDDAPRILYVSRIKPENALSLIYGLYISRELMTVEYRIREVIA